MRKQDGPDSRGEDRQDRGGDPAAATPGLIARTPNASPPIPTKYDTVRANRLISYLHLRAADLLFALVPTEWMSSPVFPLTRQCKHIVRDATTVKVSRWVRAPRRPNGPSRHHLSESRWSAGSVRPGPDLGVERLEGGDVDLREGGNDDMVMKSRAHHGWKYRPGVPVMVAAARCRWPAGRARSVWPVGAEVHPVGVDVELHGADGPARASRSARSVMLRPGPPT
jgi:hypothetical protein